MDEFRAIVAREDGDKGPVSVRLEKITEAELPAADVLVDVDYSSLNYKDGLALLNKNRILRKFPIIPGIDFAGVVRSSDSPEFRAGDRVILTGWGVGESWSGGFAERARVKSEWLVKTPAAMTNRSAMAIGTAGLTAMLCVMALERAGLRAGDKVVVTGAAGGVGSVAVALLARLGFKVTAVTGRPEQHEFLRSLGASDFVDRSELQAPGKPLQGERWKGAVDTVGGVLLANVLASIAYEGAVAACGLAGGMDLPTTVAPFILRGVSLVGVDSVNCPKARRIEAWDRLASALSAKDLDAVTSETGLPDVLGLGAEILAGRVRGRTVVAMSK
ncbi:MAG TPA: MDR family oxidoreductase [Rhodoblastus sp.]|nr:MDR family oxidoreductase [Rhodoblastus sp.]